MFKMRKSDVVIASILLALGFTWHYRADFLEIWKAAADRNAALQAACM